MSELYPPESQRMDLVGHLEELRRRLLVCLIFMGVATAGLFSQGRALLAILERPAQGLIPGFIFITPTEVLVSYFKVVFLAAFIVCFPVFLFQFWAFIAPALPSERRKIIIGWLVLAIFCFFGGMTFTYGILLPAALKFLFSFGEGLAQPAVSLARYVSFATAILLAGGCIFEIPVVMGLLTEAGILDVERLRRGRRFAIPTIFIIAAIVTPTPDVVNQLFFAVPMVILYELGIWIAVGINKRKSMRSAPIGSV